MRWDCKWQVENEAPLQRVMSCCNDQTIQKDITRTSLPCQCSKQAGAETKKNLSPTKVTPKEMKSFFRGSSISVGESFCLAIPYYRWNGCNLFICHE
jgi:hypothetical protein